MNKGGYQLVNFKKSAITAGGDPVTIAGVRAAIDNANEKMTIVSGLKIGSVEYPDVPVMFLTSSTNKVGMLIGTFANANPDTLSGHIITVSDADAVTVVTVAITSAA